MPALKSIIDQCRETPRKHSRLKTLPEELQAEIFGHACMHGLVETTNWLKGKGIKTSRSRVSEFLRWWPVQQEFERDARDVLLAMEQLKKKSPRLTEQQLEAMGRNLFSLLLIERKNSRAWLRLSKALQR